MNENNNKRNRQESDIKDDTMKQSDDYDNIDFKFIEAIDQILEKNGDLGIKPNNDSSLGKLIYPSNRSIISSVRSRSKHIPHLALINFAKAFDVDMNFFYGRSHLDYKPMTTHKSKTNSNSITISGNGNNTTHAGNGDITGVKNITNEANSSMLEVNTMINNFMSKLDKDCVNEFYRIINEVRAENTDLNNELRSHLKKKSKKIEKMALLHKEELKQVQDELKSSNQNLFEAQKNESDILKKYIASIEIK